MTIIIAATQTGDACQRKNNLTQEHRVNMISDFARSRPSFTLADASDELSISFSVVRRLTAVMQNRGILSVSITLGRSSVFAYTGSEPKIVTPAQPIKTGRTMVPKRDSAQYCIAQMIDKSGPIPIDQLLSAKGLFKSRTNRASAIKSACNYGWLTNTGGMIGIAEKTKKVLDHRASMKPIPTGGVTPSSHYNVYASGTLSAKYIPSRVCGRADAEPLRDICFSIGAA